MDCELSAIRISVFLALALTAVAGSGRSLSQSLVEGISYALCFSLLPGQAVIQHFTLRFVLSNRQGKAPHNYAKFLKYTTERRLTQQVGGSFRFIHRELLDHFAAMTVGASQEN